MPSLRTRINHDRIALANAEAALATAQAELEAAATEVAAATDDLSALQLGNLDLASITIAGMRFVNNAGVLEAE